MIRSSCGGWDREMGTRSRWTAAAPLLAGAASAACYESHPHCWADAPGIVLNVLVVRFEDGVPAVERAAYLDAHQVTEGRCDPTLPEFCIVRVAPGTDLCEAIDEMGDDEQVMYVAPDVLMYIDPSGGANGYY
jgi:hypothetical protein